VNLHAGPSARDGKVSGPGVGRRSIRREAEGLCRKGVPFREAAGGEAEAGKAPRTDNDGVGTSPRLTQQFGMACLHKDGRLYGRGSAQHLRRPRPAPRLARRSGRRICLYMNIWRDATVRQQSRCIVWGGQGGSNISGYHRRPRLRRREPGAYRPPTPSIVNVKLPARRAWDFNLGNN